MNRQNKLLFPVLILCTLLMTGCKKLAEPISASSFLLNTFVTITIYDSQDTTILDQCLTICKEYEGLFSKTIETSEIYKLNHRDPSQTSFTVSDDTAAILDKALYYSEISDGAFDITIEPLSSLWDFTKEPPSLPGQSLLEEAAGKVDYRNLKLEGNTLTFLSPETTIDLGSIAKGYIADRIKEYLTETGVNSAIINLGGNVLCVGERPGKKPFKIGLQKPFGTHSQTVATLNIDGLSVVSSGVYERHFIIDGKNYHHILDPSTGYPFDNGLIAVTIISPSSVDGDGLSTTCFSLGLEKGMELLDSMDGIYGVFITDDYEIHYTEGAKDLLD